VNQIRPDRQTLLFSATFKKPVERLARDILIDPIRIVVGTVGEANQDVAQIAHVMHEGQSKWDWLSKRLVEFVSGESASTVWESRGRAGGGGPTDLRRPTMLSGGMRD